METRIVIHPISVLMLAQVGIIMAVPVPQGIGDSKHADYQSSR